MDPLNESHLLVSAGGVYSGQWAIEIDWREDRVVRKVRVPWDTHDVDAIRNGSAYLLSPRNFDRVLVVNRTTRETEWVLGAQGDHTTLERQHNPTLLRNESAGGPVVLVADSENDRVIEYRRHDETGDWRATWTYAGNLSWPRDADRLPNGNTVIVDSGGQRVLEVTPNGSVVWEPAQRLHPYDAERQSLGDEPSGPPLTGGTVAPPGETNGGDSDSLALLAWVPPRPTLAGLLLVGWFGVELRRLASRRRLIAGRD